MTLPRSSLLLILGLIGCGGGAGDATVDAPAAVDGPAAAGQVHVVVFTHVEDNTPGGAIGSPQSRASYTRLRAGLLDVATRARARGLQWVLQPDWTMLEAALVYEDAATTATTGGKNFLRYLREDLGAVIDPHSHENGGYNYPDVAHLLTQLGVGGSTVIGGHIWDPALPQFQDWDRFRVAVAGEHYPSASWRGDLLIGAGTPNHVNDPLASGVWRPRDRDNFFVDDPAANIVAVGSWHDDLAGVDELIGLYAAGTVPATTMLTASWNLQPNVITAADGPATIDATLFAPLATRRDQGTVVVTDFATLVATWQARGGAAGLYRP